MQLFRFICRYYILKELNFLFFLQKWLFFCKSGQFLILWQKKNAAFPFRQSFFVCLKMGDFKQCIFMHIIQVCKTIFSAGFHGAKAPSSICLKYRLYTNTQKVYESIPFISLNFSSPHPWPAPLHPTPWGFPAFPVFKDIQGIYEKEICPLKNKKILPEREGSILSYMGPRSGGIQRGRHGTHRRCEGSEGSEGSKGGGALWGADFKERGRGWRRRLCRRVV